MPTDNPDSIAPGDAVSLPRNGPSSDTTIARSGTAAFQLEDAGTYLVLFHAVVQNPAQMVLALNGTELPATVAGTTGDGVQISGMSLVTAPAGAVLSLVNPASAAEALTLAQSADNPLSAHMVILQLTADSASGTGD